MHLSRLLIIFISTAFLIMGCDNTAPTNQTRKTQKESVRYSGHDKKDVRDKLERTAQVLATIGPNHAAFSSVRKTLDLRRKQGYAEDVSFAHLLEEKPASKAKSLRSDYASASTSFRSAIDELRSNTEDANTDPFSKELRNFLVDKGITLAWLQRENFKSMPAAPTITYHPLTKEAEEPNSGLEVPGFKPVEGERGSQYSRVIVDKNYVENNPTLVVRPCETGLVEGPKVNKYCEVKAKTSAPVIGDGGGGGGGGGGGSGGDGGNTDKNLTTNDKFKVVLDDIQCTNDTDGFLSGGPEIKIVNVEPEVNDIPVDPTNGNVDSFTSIDSFSGSDCDANEWHHAGETWDSIWEDMDDENGLLVYDHDDLYGGEVSFSLEYSGTIQGQEVSGSAEFDGFSYENNNTWKKIDIYRHSYVNENHEDCEFNGTRDGVCIRGIGNGNITFRSNIID